MPTGFTDSLTPAARFIEWLQPHRTLDIGVGSGRMGFLAREYSDVPAVERHVPGRRIVDGIEGYAPYIGALQTAIYDNIMLGEATIILANMSDRYDLAIASDIIEHFTPDDGCRFIELASSVADVLLIVTPGFFMEQSSEDNLFEIHRSYWAPRTLKSKGAAIVESYELSTFAYFGDSVLLDAFRAQQARQIRRWLLPPEIHRVLRQLRRRT